MHESSLARQILEVVLERAREAGATKVRAVHGWVAETEALSAESLALSFALHARGTAAEGAELALRLTHVEARCRRCGATFKPEHHVLLCPTCGECDAEELGECGLGIETLEVE